MVLPASQPPVRPHPPLASISPLSLTSPHSTQTLCLLCAALAWREAEKAKLAPPSLSCMSSSSGPGGGTRLAYEDAAVRMLQSPWPNPRKLPPRACSQHRFMCAPGPRHGRSLAAPPHSAPLLTPPRSPCLLAPSAPLPPLRSLAPRPRSLCPLSHPPLSTRRRSATWRPHRWLRRRRCRRSSSPHGRTARSHRR